MLPIAVLLGRLPAGGGLGGTQNSDSLPVSCRHSSVQEELRLPSVLSSLLSFDCVALIDYILTQ